MTKNKPNPKVTAALREEKQWQAETQKLRTIALDCGLAEDLKWSKPCYSVQGGNVVIIQGFKAYCALLFFKGLLLKDTHKLLVKTGENTFVGRQIRFTNLQQITAQEAALKSYILQAVELEKSGAKVPAVKTATPKIPVELQNKFAAQPALKTAFEALTPGRQRAYIFYFSGAKQSSTRDARIEKYIPLIFDGIGLNDEYISSKKKK